jgi:hypothetical protein
MCTGTRRCFPSPLLPHVGVSVPAVVTSNPYMLAAWCNVAPLYLHSGWCNSHYNFGSLDGPDSQGGRKQRG